MNLSKLKNYCGLVVIPLLLGYTNLHAQQTAQMTSGGVGYWEFLPDDYNTTTKEYPLLLFLHGIGERGNGISPGDLDKVDNLGPPRKIKDGHDMKFQAGGTGPEFQFIVISPQLSTAFNSWFGQVDPILDYILANYRVDLSRVYLTGLSLGGIGTLEYAVNEAEKLTALVVAAGRGPAAKACNIVDVPLWAHHGDADTVVPIGGITNFVNALNNCVPGPPVAPILTVYPGVAHNSWSNTYKTDNSLHTPNIYEWLLLHTKSGLSVDAGSDKTLIMPTNSTNITANATATMSTITSYSWTQISGPSVTINNASSATVSLSNMVEGVYEFQITVGDDQGNTAFDNVVVNVIVVNQAPTANAGSDINISLPTNSTNVAGSGSDSDGSVVSYFWKQISGPDNTSSVFVNFTSSLNSPAPWNNTLTAPNAGTAIPNLLDDGGANSGITLTLVDSWGGAGGAGVDTGNDSGIYPDNVMRSFYSIGDPADVEYSGLDPGSTYDFTFFGSHSNSSGNRTADYTIGSTTVTLSATLNSTNVVKINDVFPDAMGKVVANTARATGAGLAYLNAMVVETNASMSNAGSPTLALSDLQEGTYTFELTVTDNDGATGTDQVTVTVGPAGSNQAPTADAGSPVLLTLPTNSTNLAGSGSDTDGTITDYLWTKQSGPSVTLSNETTATVSLSSLVEGSYTFRLTVTDDDGATGFAETTVTVSAANVAPTAEAGPPLAIMLPTNSTNINGSGSDTDGSISTYAWTQQAGPNSATLSNANAATLTASNMIEGTYTFRLTVTDDDGATGFDETDVTVSPVANQSPTANAGSGLNLTLPTNFGTLMGSGTDTDGTISSYSWAKISGPSASLTNETTANLLVSGLVEGTYVFRLTVTDDDGATDTDDATVNVAPAIVNQTPTANAGSDNTITLPAANAQFIGSGSDNDGTIVSYAWTKESGPAVTLSGETTQNLLLTNFVEGVYIFRLTVTDDDGATAFDDVTLTVNAANLPPTVDAGSNQVLVLPTDNTSLTATADDADGIVTGFSWSKVSGPTATEANANTNTILLSNLLEGTYIYEVEVTDDDAASATDQVTITVNAATPNQLPTANAGSPINIILPTNSTNIFGMGTDTDGTIDIYAWTQQAGPNSATLSNASSATVTASNMIEGAYTFRLTVTDNDGGTAFDEVTVTVSAPANQAPTANAGSDKTITLPVNSTSLVGSGSDVDGSIASYSWIKQSGPAATLTNQNTSTLSLSNLLEGSYVFQLTVTDDDGATDTDLASVVVQPAIVNQSPTADAGSDIIITLPVNSTNISGSGSDTDGTITTYLWELISGPSATLTGTGTPTLSASDMLEGSYVFRLTVTDDMGATASDNVTVTVQPLAANQLPTANAGSNVLISLPTNSVNLLGSGSDPDGSIAVYLWEKVSGPAAGTLTNADNPTLQLSGLEAGIYTFRLTVTDDDGDSDSDDVTVTVEAEVVNQAPTADAGVDVSLTLPNNAATLNGSGSDSDGTIASYSWSKFSGPSATLGPANQPDLDLTNLVEGSYVFRLTVTDDDGATGSDDISVNVLAMGVNQPPVANAGTNVTIQLPVNSTPLNGSGTDADGTIAAYTWSKQSGPAATITNGDQEDASANDLVEGVYVFRLTVTDDDGDTGNDDVTITVIPAAVNQNPIADAGEDQVLNLPDDTATLDGSGSSDPDGSIASYAWAQVSGPTTTLSGESTATLNVSGLTEDTFGYMLTVTDNSGAIASDEVTITVGAALLPPVADAGPDQELDPGTTTLALSGTAVDNDGFVVQLEWAQVDGPTVTLVPAVENPDITVGLTERVVNISDLVPGTYNFELTATDNSNLADSDQVTIVVNDVVVETNEPPVADAGPDVTITLPTNSVTIEGSASDPDGEIAALLWEQISGATADLTGTDSETLTASNLIEGTYTFSLTATDDDDETASDEVSVEVLPEVFDAPKLFTPNGDGIGDFWVIPGVTDTNLCQLVIFNKFGREVFTANPYRNDWAGDFNGSPLEEGAYYYILKCDDGRELNGGIRIIK